MKDEKYLLNSENDFDVMDYVQLYEEGDVIRLKDEPDTPRRILKSTPITTRLKKPNMKTARSARNGLR